MPERSGEQFLRKLEKAVAEGGCASTPRLHPVECMAVCKRPCTVAVSATNKWTYIIGDLDVSCDVEELLKYVDLYAASETGMPDYKDRPAAIRKGTIARIPFAPAKS